MISHSGLPAANHPVEGSVFSARKWWHQLVPLHCLALGLLAHVVRPEHGVSNALSTSIENLVATTCWAGAAGTWHGLGLSCFSVL